MSPFIQLSVYTGTTQASLISVIYDLVSCLNNLSPTVVLNFMRMFGNDDVVMIPVLHLYTSYLLQYMRQNAKIPKYLNYHMNNK